MKKLSKIFFALAILLMIAMPLSAAKAMNVTWQWLLNDPYVTAYRYQIDGEEADGWTVVDGNTDTYTATGLDPYKDYTLFLQCTYDGRIWSESATSTALALLQYEVETVETVEETAEASATAGAVVVLPVEEEKTIETSSFSVLGFTVENSWCDGTFTSTLREKGIVYESDIRGFALYEIGKYGSYLSDNVAISFVDDGFVLFYPITEDPALYLKAYKADLEEYFALYIASLEAEAAVEEKVEEVVVVEEAKAEERSFSVFGIRVDNSWKDGSFQSTCEAKGFLTEDDIRGFALYEIGKYGSFLSDNVAISFIADGFMLTYPEAIDPSLYLDAYRSDIVEYVYSITEAHEEVKVEEVKAEETAPVEETVVEVPEETKAEEPVSDAETPAAPETPVAVDVPQEEAKAEEKAEEPKADEKLSSFGVKLGVGLGGEFGINNAVTYATLFPRVDITLDFQNIVSISRFGLGARFGISSTFKPLDGTFVGHEFDFFLNGNNWAMDAVADAKLMTYLNFGSVTLYAGAGAGYSMASATFYPYTHSSATQVFGFDTALAATATAGFDWTVGKAFTLTLEGNYRYFFQSAAQAQTIAATLGMGFKF